MIADDDIEFCQLLSEYLGGQGYAVVTAHDGEEALARAADSGAEAMVLDVMMPKKDGHNLRTKQSGVAALDAIDSRGRDGVRMVGIARASGVTTGAVVHYFEDKEAVLDFALRQFIDRLIALIEQNQENYDPLIGAAYTMPHDEETRRDWRIWLQFIGRAASRPDMGQQHEDYYSRLVAQLAMALKGAGAIGDVMQLADGIIAAIDGISLRATMQPDDWPLERQLDLLRLMIGPTLAQAGIKTYVKPAAPIDGA